MTGEFRQIILDGISTVTNMGEIMVQQLDLEDLSFLKRIEDVLPKNVKLTIDYEVTDDTESFDVKDIDEFTDYIEEEEAVILENGAAISSYYSLFGKCFMRSDYDAVVRIFDDSDMKKPHMKDEYNMSIECGVVPFTYERIDDFGERSQEDLKRYPDMYHGWNYSVMTEMTYESLGFKNSKKRPGIGINFPYDDADCLFRLDADGMLWSQSYCSKEWFMWHEIDEKEFIKIHNIAQKQKELREKSKNKKNKKLRKDEQRSRRVDSKKN